MKLSHRFLGALVLGLGLTSAAVAQPYPNRPVTIIIPFAPGGGTDVVARAMAPAFGAKLGATIVLENVSGAAGNIAATRVARATPDGYTLIMHNLAFALNPGLYAKLPYDTEKDFVPIAMINYTPNVLVARKDFPASTIPELVAWMKTNTARLAHPGVGSSGHIQVALLAKAVGVNADFIPYRGGGPMLQDVIAGHVDMGTVTLGNAVEPVNGGQVKGIGLTANAASKLLPQVPALAPALGPTLDILFWNILMAPAGTPQAIIDKVNAAYEETIKDRQLLESWARMGIDLYKPEERTPQAARELVRREVERWGKIIRDNKIEAVQ